MSKPRELVGKQLARAVSLHNDYNWSMAELAQEFGVTIFVIIKSLATASEQKDAAKQEEYGKQCIECSRVKEYLDFTRLRTGDFSDKCMDCERAVYRKTESSVQSLTNVINTWR